MLAARQITGRSELEQRVLSGGRWEKRPRQEPGPPWPHSARAVVAMRVRASPFLDRFGSRGERSPGLVLTETSTDGVGHSQGVWMAREFKPRRTLEDRVSSKPSCTPSVTVFLQSKPT